MMRRNRFARVDQLLGHRLMPLNAPVLSLPMCASRDDSVALACHFVVVVQHSLGHVLEDRPSVLPRRVTFGVSSVVKPMDAKLDLRRPLPSVRIS